jgi:hypothetical protein
MHVFDFVQGVLAKLASMSAALRRSSEFTCGDCERMERCGLPPSDDCIEKAAQIERKHTLEALDERNGTRRGMNNGVQMAIGRASVVLMVVVWASPGWTQTHDADFPEQMAAINRCYVAHP